MQPSSIANGNWYHDTTDNFLRFRTVLFGSKGVALAIFSFKWQKFRLNPKGIAGINVSFPAYDRSCCATVNNYVCRFIRAQKEDLLIMFRAVNDVSGGSANVTMEREDSCCRSEPLPTFSFARDEAAFLAASFFLSAALDFLRLSNSCLQAGTVTAICGPLHIQQAKEASLL
eukprot:IDg17251t1